MNDDRSVSPLDVLAVINHLNSVGAGVQSEGSSDNQRFYVDVNGDCFASAVDALMIINYLNGRTAALAESESIGSGPGPSANYRAVQSFSGDLSLANAGLSDQSRKRKGEEAPNSQRSIELSAMPLPSGETSHQPTRQVRTAQAADEAAQAWESILDAIAKDTSEAWSAPA